MKRIILLSALLWTSATTAQSTEQTKAAPRYAALKAASAKQRTQRNLFILSATGGLSKLAMKEGDQKIAGSGFGYGAAVGFEHFTSKYAQRKGIIGLEAGYAHRAAKMTDDTDATGKFGIDYLTVGLTTGVRGDKVYFKFGPTLNVLLGSKLKASTDSGSVALSGELTGTAFNKVRVNATVETGFSVGIIDIGVAAAWALTPTIKRSLIGASPSSMYEIKLGIRF